jgi:predicted MFS family arabinose efflux permease
MRSSVFWYSAAAVFQAAGSSGAATLAPFFMKEQGFGLAMVGMPLTINGLGRISSDLVSGLLATYFSSGALATGALTAALAAAIVGLFTKHITLLFFVVWSILGFSEAMFALALRKMAFDRSAPQQQGRAQGGIAAALAVGFTLGPVLAGWIGSRWGSQALFAVYALPQAVALTILLLAGSRKIGKPVRETRGGLSRETAELIRRPSFLAACAGLFQAFFFLAGVTRVAFPFFAVSRLNLTLDAVGAIVGLSRLADTAGRFLGGWLSDRFGTAPAVQAGILISVPMFVLQLYGDSFVTLLLPLAVMTMGFGLTNVGGVTCALQTASNPAKGIALGLARASNSVGTMLGPVAVGSLIQAFDYEGGFVAMAAISLAIFSMTWYGFRVDSTAAPK